MEKLTTYKAYTVRKMIKGNEEDAERKGDSLENSIPDDVNKFDDLFNDGGEGRCEEFCDFGYEYALQFGTFDDYEKGDNGFEGKLWSCINSAMAKLQKKYNKVR